MWRGIGNLDYEIQTEDSPHLLLPPPALSRVFLPLQGGGPMRSGLLVPLSGVQPLYVMQTSHTVRSSETDRGFRSSQLWVGRTLQYRIFQHHLFSVSPLKAILLAYPVYLAIC